MGPGSAEQPDGRCPASGTRCGLRQHFTDISGGTGANFVVDWAASGDIADPVVEALMVGSIGSGHYAFTTQGRPVKVVGNN